MRGIELKWETLLKVIVIAAVLLFVFETFAFVVLGKPQGRANETGGEGTSFASVGYGKGVLSSYAPYLLLPPSVEEKTLKELSKMEGIDEIRRGKESIVLSLSDGKYAPAIYKFLRGKNISAITKAYVYFPEGINISGKAYPIESLLTLPLPPLAEEGKTLNFLVRVEVENGKVTKVYDIKPIIERKEIEVEGKVVSFLGVEKRITLPWENRTMRFGENAEYKINNYVIINTSQPILERKEYVREISDNVIVVDENFTDVERIKEDYDRYGEIYFPPSYAIIYENLSLPLENVTTFYIYNISLGEKSITYISPIPLRIGENITIKINATVSGDVVLSYSNIR